MRGATRVLGRAGAGAAAGLLGVLALGAPAPALPATTPPAGAQALPGEWWWDAMGVDELHERGTGSGITVAVIDGPIDPDVPELRGTVASTTSECLDPDAPSTAEADPRPSTVHGPEAEHATSMAALVAGTGRGTGPGGRGIRGIAPDATIRHYAVLYRDAQADDGYTCGVVFPTSDDVDKSVGLAIGQAARDGADVISISLVGQYSTEMVEGLVTAYREGAVVVAGTGNARGSVEWPGLGNGVVLVNPVDRRGRASDFAARSPHIGLAAPGEDVMAGRYEDDGWHSDALASGASVATALVSGGIADLWSAHPEATAGQVLQAVRRTPGLRADPDGSGYATWFRRVGEDLPQVRSPNEFYGWGIFDPADAVALDVASLPRTNPFVRDEVSAQPSADEVAAAMAEADPVSPSPTRSASPTGPGGATASSDPAATSAAAPERAASDGPSLLPLVLVGVAVLAALAAGGAWLVRRGRPGPPDPSDPSATDPGTTDPEHPPHDRRRDRRRGEETLMAIPKDDGAAVPALPADAGPHERTLHKVFGFSSALVRDTAEDWRQTADGVEGLSRDVRWVVTALRGADEPWSGPAAENAYASLTALSASLDEHAEMMRNIKKSLDVAAQAADDARSDYRGKVATVSTDVDRTGYTRTVTPDGPVTSPAQERTVFDQQGYDQAVANRQQQREDAAKTALDTFTSSMGGAAKTMPVDAPFDPVTIDPGTGGDGSAPTGGGPSGGSPGPVSYSGPSGPGSTWSPPSTTGWTGSDPGGSSVDGSPSTTVPPSGGPTSTTTPYPGSPSWSGGGVELDGSTTGTTTPTEGGSTSWAGTSPSGGPGSTGGGVGAGAAGAGGLLGGGAMLLGRGALGRGAAFGLPGGAAGRPGSVVAGSTGSGARGTSAAGGRGATGSGRPVVAPGSQGTARGGRGAGGSGVRGARSGGRYGVPKLGRSGGPGGAAGSGRGVVAGTGAGGRGRKDRDDAVDVEALTHEDEETWFEGEDEAGPPVWR